MAWAPWSWSAQALDHSLGLEMGELLVWGKGVAAYTPGVFNSSGRGLQEATLNSPLALI